MVEFIRTKDDEVTVITGAIRRAKLQSNHHHQQTNTRLFKAGCPFCRPTNNVRTLKGESITFNGLAHPKLTWGSSVLVLMARGYLVRGLSSAGWYLRGGRGEHVLVSEFRLVALSYFVLMCYAHSISSLH